MTKSIISEPPFNNKIGMVYNNYFLISLTSYNKNMNRILFLLLIFLSSAYSTLAQQSFVCGTEVTMQNIKEELKNKRDPASTIPDLCLKKEISIYAYIVKDSIGKPNLTPTQIDAGITIVNKYFAPICLTFKICKIIYIDNWKYDLFHDKKEENEIKNLYCTPNVINMLFVEKIESPVGAAGYAPLATALPGLPTTDLILIQKSTASGGIVMTHELGHFFGLYHTFETKFGIELVDASNCATTGDLICDTEADYNPVSMVGCQYIGNKKDAAGNFYMPPIGNIMAYHPCSCKFTTQQYNRMAFVFLNYRKYLL
jgi:hypothetical protein